jgi:predicted nucleic acid-binding protein
VLSWRDAFAVVDTSAAVIVNATDLASDHGRTIWDSVVLAASAEAGCRLLLSEDLQEGFTWRGVTVTNPFAPTLNPILAALLAAPQV